MNKPKFDISNYRDATKSYMMICQSDNEGKIFQDYLHSVGMKWCSGKSYEEFGPWDSFTLSRRIGGYLFGEGTFIPGSIISYDELFPYHQDVEKLLFSGFSWGEQLTSTIIWNEIDYNEPLKENETRFEEYDEDGAPIQYLLKFKKGILAATGYVRDDVWGDLDFYTDEFTPFNNPKDVTHWAYMPRF